jgi:hypothetical protein
VAYREEELIDARAVIVRAIELQSLADAEQSYRSVLLQSAAEAGVRQEFIQQPEEELRENRSRAERAESASILMTRRSKFILIAWQITLFLLLGFLYRGAGSPVPTAMLALGFSIMNGVVFPRRHLLAFSASLCWGFLVSVYITDHVPFNWLVAMTILGIAIHYISAILRERIIFSFLRLSRDLHERIERLAAPPKRY